jgi:hypothetical protein
MKDRFFNFKGKKGGVVLCAAFSLAVLFFFVSADNAVIFFVNKTPWPVHIVAGSGRVDICDIEPFGSVQVKNTSINAESYYPLFDLPLTGNFWLKDIRPADKDLYFQIDTSLKKQEIEITRPRGFNDGRAFVIMTNETKTGGIFLSRNDSMNRMTTIDSTEIKMTVNAGETVVYGIDPDGITHLTIRPNNIPTGPIALQRGFIYHFLFDGTSISTLDVRPLYTAGEKGWVKPLDRAIEMPCLAADGSIHVFSAAEGEIEYSAFAAADGTETGKTSVAEDGAFVYAVISGHGGDFIAAGSSGSYNESVPFLWKKTNEGLERMPFASSYRNAVLLTLAQGDSAILAAGSALKEGMIGNYTAYLRALRDEGTRMVPLWELGPDDFDEKYGEVSSAMYDAKKGIWRVTGKTLEGGSITGAYLMEIGGSGAIRKIDASFRGFSFYKIIGGNDGSYYLIGEEEKGDASSAAIIKYDENGKLLWRQKTPLPAFSYYVDALISEDGKQIVLAGTMRANNAAGMGGVPFIQGIETATGGETWRSELTDRNFQGASLVSAIVKAPEYGYAAALCGISGGTSEKPYLIIRVNERGLLLK